MFKTYFLDVIMHHYVDFKGRATRTEFWLFTLCYSIIAIILGVIAAFDTPVQTLFTVLYYLFCLAVFLPSIALSVRRLHDINFSGWWLLIYFIPLIGQIALLVFYVLPSKEPNRFAL